MVKTDEDEEAQEEALAGLYAEKVKAKPFMDEEDYRERSANLWADPKLREMNLFTRSHKYEERMRQNLGLTGGPDMTASGPLQAMRETTESRRESRPVSRGTEASTMTNAERQASLRSSGCDELNRNLKRIGAEKVMLPRVGADVELPACFFRPDSAGSEVLGPNKGRSAPASPSWSKTITSAQRRQRLINHAAFETRLHWRESMDNSLKRLILDVELANDKQLKDYSHRSRCDHLDKIYDWYLKHGMKEAKKERPGPPYICYNPSAPVMAGSMRIAPMRWENSAPQLRAVEHLDHKKKEKADVSAEVPG